MSYGEEFQLEIVRSKIAYTLGLVAVVVVIALTGWLL